MKHLTACLSVSAAILAATAQVTAQGLFDELVVFGDSSSDNGNDNLLTHGLVVPPPYWGGRFSNGPLWVERLAERLGLGHPTERHPVPAPSEAGGTCYAYGGARAGSGFNTDACAVIDGALTCVPNIGLQIEYFFEDGRTLDGDELIVVQGGANNAFQAELAARAIGDHIDTLAAAGGRFFLVPNLDRLGPYPGTSPDPAWDRFAFRFNAELEAELAALEEVFDITIIRLDWLGLLDAIIADLATFGLANVTDPACPDCGEGLPAPGAEDTVVPNPEEYLFWDDFHWTAVVHAIVGDVAADVVEAAVLE